MYARLRMRKYVIYNTQWLFYFTKNFTNFIIFFNEIHEIFIEIREILEIAFTKMDPILQHRLV